MSTIIKNTTTDDIGNEFLTISQDGIEFSGIPNNGLELSSRVGVKCSYTSGGNEQINVVNAIDIDWGSAKLGSTTINTTGQFLSYVSNIGKAADAVKNAGVTVSKTAVSDTSSATKFVSNIGVTNTGSAYTITYQMSTVDYSSLTTALSGVTATNNELKTKLENYEKTYANYKVVSMTSVPVKATTIAKYSALLSKGAVVAYGNVLYTIKCNSYTCSSYSITDLKPTTAGSYTITYQVFAADPYDTILPSSFRTSSTISFTVS